ncbi:MAG: pyridoxamine 5'-phosphate oxidase family protein [Actinobacteria bacterium]|nr:pyridoxamine 5'-phosphate oxidase family protein [Actinomycetota bacterium]
MTEEEVSGFLADQLTVSCATVGPGGRPHLVPLWYFVAGDELRAWTYAKSQKAKNLERDRRATLLVEDGVAYDELRGVMLECDVEFVRGEELIELAVSLFDRYAGRGPEIRAMIEAQAPKRIGLRFRPTRVVSWDHRKLGGAY